MNDTIYGALVLVTAMVAAMGILLMFTVVVAGPPW